jgi:hypothetical protein
VPDTQQLSAMTKLADSSKIVKLKKILRLLIVFIQLTIGLPTLDNFLLNHGIICKEYRGAIPSKSISTFLKV